VVLGPSGQPTKTKIGTVIKVLDKLIDKKNGPFLIIAWTKHPECIEKIKEKLKDHHVFILDIKKIDCQESIDGEMVFSIEKIENNMSIALKNIGFFQIYSLWENLVQDASIKSVNNFSSFCSNPSDWNKEMCRIFYSLAKANAGKQLNENDKLNIIKNAFSTFNNAFLDSLENQFNNIEYLLKTEELSVDFSNNPIENGQTRASINSMLLLSFNEMSEKIEPGSVCRIKPRNSKTITDLIDPQFVDYEKISELKKSFIPILLEVSPSCDYSQDKWKLHRQIPGVLWPVDFIVKIVKGKDKEIVKNAEYIYKSPAIIFNKKIYKMVFDLRDFSTSNLKTSKKSIEKKSFQSLDPPIFRVRHDLLIEIQFKISQHINRPGFVYL
jgi:hypothetical protein